MFIALLPLSTLHTEWEKLLFLTFLASPLTPLDEEIFTTPAARRLLPAAQQLKRLPFNGLTTS
jgi:hypothetical protein